MSQKPEGGGAPPEAARPAVLDVDALIGEAVLAAGEAQRLAAVEQAAGAKTKKTVAEEKAERAEALQLVFAKLKAEPGNEDVWFEGVFDYAAQETGVAAPEGIQKSIDALRKIGPALRELAKVEPRSPALEKKLAELRSAYETLFTQVQQATVYQLNRLQEKYVGEKDEWANRYAELANSPLVRGIEAYDQNSPEARERATKQEIAELLLRPYLDARVRSVEDRITTIRKQNVEIEEELKKINELSSTEWRKEELRKTFNAKWENILGRRDGITNIDYIIKDRSQKADQLEALLPGERQAFAYNQAVVEAAMQEIQGETVAQEAFADLRQYMEAMRKYAKEKKDPSDMQNRATLTNAHAEKLLGRLLAFGAPSPAGPYDTGIRELRVSTLLLDPAVKDYSDAYSVISGLNNDAKADFIKTLHPSVTEEYEREVRRAIFPDRSASPKDELFDFQEVGRLEEVFSKAQKYQKGEFTTYEMSSFSSDATERSAAQENATQAATSFLAAYPTAEALVGALYRGQGKFLNMRRALARAAKSEVAPMDGTFKTIGWKETTLGAVAEPGQDVSQVDRAYAQFLEQITGPQVEGERAFDVRGEHGEYHVYTLDQAMDIVRRVRRDARQMVRDLHEAEAKHGALAGTHARKMEEHEEEKRISAVEGRRLNEKIARLEAELEAKKKESEQRASALGKEERTRQALERERMEVLVALGAVLKVQTSFRQGAKPIYAAVQEIIDRIKPQGK